MFVKVASGKLAIQTANTHVSDYATYMICCLRENDYRKSLVAHSPAKILNATNMIKPFSSQLWKTFLLSLLVCCSCSVLLTWLSHNKVYNPLQALSNLLLNKDFSSNVLVIWGVLLQEYPSFDSLRYRVEGFWQNNLPTPYTSLYDNYEEKK